MVMSTITSDDDGVDLSHFHNDYDDDDDNQVDQDMRTSIVMRIIEDLIRDFIFTFFLRGLGSFCDGSTVGPKELFSHLASVTAVSGPPFLPHFRFPFLFPRHPVDVNSNNAGPLLFPPPPLPPPGPPLPSPFAPMPPLSFPPQTTFFTLADLDLCLYGNTGWLTSACPSSGKTRTYAFSGLKTRFLNFRGKAGGRGWFLVSQCNKQINDKTFKWA